MPDKLRERLASVGIKVPKHWDIDYFVEVFLNYDPAEIPTKFGCISNKNFTRMMFPIFTEKQPKTTYYKTFLEAWEIISTTDTRPTPVTAPIPPSVPSKYLAFM